MKKQGLKAGKHPTASPRDIHNIGRNAQKRVLSALTRCRSKDNFKFHPPLFDLPIHPSSGPTKSHLQHLPNSAAPVFRYPAFILVLSFFLHSYSVTLVFFNSFPTAAQPLFLALNKSCCSCISCTFSSIILSQLPLSLKKAQGRGCLHATGCSPRNARL
ncbi:hypothetical protein BC829DRAFT_99073 [Chytridium lagenaria]|nr:hypothetical protein BC829DRAFT_99073 [Chytridium lagenaria]